MQGRIQNIPCHSSYGTPLISYLKNLFLKFMLKILYFSTNKCQDFPLSKAMLLDVLEVVAPVKHFSKLREFVEMKLPPGFPVKVDIPILPTITTRVNFQDFEFRNNMPDTLFQIPKDYTENPGRYFYKLETIFNSN